jgi:CDP-diacylglycerol--glycerol-3-phosphate 3-phosphatidyltransferase
MATTPAEHNPNAIITIANTVTVTRLLVSPFLFSLIDGDEGGWAAFVLWFFLCLSDGVDGFIARRRGTTRSGAFLDPLADKVLILGAMFALVGQDVFWVVPVVLIAVRELVITLYRTIVGHRGVSVPASYPAKLKTLAQQLAVGFALLPLSATDATWTWQLFLWVAVALALVSGAQYLWHARRPSVT